MSLNNLQKTPKSCCLTLIVLGRHISGHVTPVRSIVIFLVKMVKLANHAHCNKFSQYWWIFEILTNSGSFSILLLKCGGSLKFTPVRCNELVFIGFRC
jgi:hypothetical protein